MLDKVILAFQSIRETELRKEWKKPHNSNPGKYLNKVDSMYHCLLFKLLRDATSGSIDQSERDTLISNLYRRSKTKK
uniref:AlNc14C4G591 protein n=1 Tax=Albugo laibachii Nc14 TaxID=890382 RepID=F0W0E8_9STRA|nr:AlNc14C4G591 [Albugo laibachii Nc14]|eukprot:CCA14520.1 AlNc14C4G591 [Albugo laibachii Nc14]